MANQKHIDLIKKGTLAWNEWRLKNSAEVVDLRHAKLGKLDLEKAEIRNGQLEGVSLRWAYMRKARLSGANLVRADLRIVDLSRADLRGANLAGANLAGAYLREANLTGANLSGANLVGVNFDDANLSSANLEAANLRNAVLVDTNLQNSNLNGACVYGASVWNAKMEGAKQHDLRITPKNEANITVDNLKIAQFIYLLLNNREIRDVIDSLTSKVVLILGRFTPERKIVLDAIREELRARNYLPVVFDFELPNSRDTDETVNLLARMARFVVADLTEARSVPQELKGIVEALPSVPVQPILLQSHQEYGMFDHIQRYPWVLPPIRYSVASTVISPIAKEMIARAELKATEQGNP